MNVDTISRKLIDKGKKLLKKCPFIATLHRNVSFFFHTSEFSKHKYKIVQRLGINLILDVGAHKGETGLELRYFGYSNRIISFEPFSEAFSKLKEKTQKDPLWESYPFALGKQSEKRKINILNNSCANSLLEISDILTAQYQTHKVREEEIQVKRLDEIYSQFYKPSDRIFLKIDAQGFEKQVLEGAENCFINTVLIQLEVSFVSLYKDEPLMNEILLILFEKGYVPIAIDPHPYHKKTLYQYQADILFTKHSLSHNIPEIQ